MNTTEEHIAVTNFRKYLRIDSSHPDIDYDPCVKFLTSIAEELQLPVNVYHLVEKKPVVIITWTGSEPELPSILLNSHMDVVPVYPEFWKYDPFEAVKEENGDIYARGAQDMKCVGIQYLETIRRYKQENLRFKRTIHLSFVPDEEIGGERGMGVFVESAEFMALNVGFSLDEGMANPSEQFTLYYAERSIWQIWVTCLGTAGHGSIIHENTAGEKVKTVINKFLDLREKEKQKLLSNPDFTVGDVTTVNLTMLEGGVQLNVVPPLLKVGFDIRLALDVDHEEFENRIRNWFSELDGVEVVFKTKQSKVLPTKLDSSNPWWLAFKKAADKLDLKLKLAVFPGGTDSRFIRKIGIPAIGFSPMNNTPILLHDHNEFLNEKIFLHGLDIYYEIIQSLANL